MAARVVHPYTHNRDVQRDTHARLLLFWRLHRISVHFETGRPPEAKAQAIGHTFRKTL